MIVSSAHCHFILYLLIFILQRQPVRCLIRRKFVYDRQTTIGSLASCLCRRAIGPTPRANANPGKRFRVYGMFFVVEG